jgi:hypothetical protein
MTVNPPTVRPGDMPSARAANLQRALAFEGQHLPAEGWAMEHTPAGLALPRPRPPRAAPRAYLPPAPDPYGSVWQFGIALAAAVVTVYPGSITRGGVPDDAAQVDVTISAANHYICWRLDTSTNTLSVLPASYAARPANSGVYVYGRLYQFALDGGTVARLLKDLRWSLNADLHV